MTRVMVTGYDCRQGLGWLAKRFYDAGVVTDPVIYRHSHPSRKSEPIWYPPDTPVIYPHQHRGFSNLQWVRDKLKDVQVLLAFETFFDWNVVNVCRDLGVKTVLCPMYEWTPRVWPAKPDYILAPSLLDYDYFKDEFPEHIQFIPIPVETGTWQLRKRAEVFLHNAGNVGHREHKGTRQLVEAIPLVKSPARFVLKAQDRGAMESILRDALKGENYPNVTVNYVDEPWERMWDGCDIYVAPEKLNGLSLPLAESYAAGLPVITTDRYPANTWLPKEPLIQPASVHRACIGQNYREFDECVVEPADIAAKLDLWYGRDITAESEAAREWAERNSWAALKSRYVEFFDVVASSRTV